MTDLFLRGSVPFPVDGTITFVIIPSVSTWYWHQPFGINKFTSNQINPNAYPGVLTLSRIRPLDFTHGVAGVRMPYGQDILFDPGDIGFTTGQIQISVPTPPVAGSITEFGLWPAGAHDPAQFYVETATQNNSLGGLGKNWVRHSAIFGASRGYGNYPQVTYIGVGAKIAGVPNSANHYLKMVQVEPAPPFDGNTYPSVYGQAREVQVTVHPDRLNFSENPAFLYNGAHWSGNNHGGTLTRVADGDGWAALVTIPANASVNIKHDVESIVIGRRYTFSTHVYAPDYSDVTWAIDGGEILNFRNYADSPTEDRFGELRRNSPYRRMWVTFEATSTTVTFNITPTPITFDSTAYVTESLLEEGEPLGQAIGSYFDGASGIDYLWEVGGNPGSCRSYYYKNRAERRAALIRILQNNVPLGIGIAEPLFAVLPYTDDTIGMFEPYGSGFYGFGVYGG